MAFILAVLLLGAGADYYLHLSWIMPSQSDAATPLLAAWDMLHGNLFLHGWTLDVNNAWLTEVPISVAGLAIARNLDPALMHIVPVVVLLAVVMLLAGAATAGLSPGFARRMGLVMAILPLVLLTPAELPWMVMRPYHTGTTGIAIAAALVLYLEQRPGTGRRVRVLLAAAAFALLVAGQVSDPYATVLGVVPIVITSMWRAAGVRSLGRRLELLRPAGIGAAAWLTATIGLQVVTQFGGFTRRPFDPSLVPLANMGTSFFNLVPAFLALGGAYFFRQAPDCYYVAYAVRLAYLVGGMYAVWAVLRHPRFKQDWLLTVLSVAAALSIAAGALETATLAYRYRVPPLILVGAVLGRYVATTARAWLEQRKVLAGALIVAATFVFAWPPGGVLPLAKLVGPDTMGFGPRLLGQWLRHHGLVSGYGEYWIAAITTVETNGQVRVRAVAPVPGRGTTRVGPFPYGFNTAWYTGGDATFLVLDPADRVWNTSMAVSSAVAANTFGPPARAYVVGRRYLILVWDRPLKFR